MADRTEVLILGGGACAQQLADHLSQLNVSVLVVSAGQFESGHKNSRPASGGIQWQVESQMVRCGGNAGNFHVVLQHRGRLIEKQVAAIVLAEDFFYQSNFQSYGLVPGERVWTVARMQAELAREEKNALWGSKATVVFLDGWQFQSHPAQTRRSMEQCLQLQQNSLIQTFFLTGNLKVGSNGLEYAYQEAKSKGAIFLKFDRNFPEVRMLPDGRVQFDCPDDSADLRLQITADYTVVDEILRPADILGYLGERLAVQSDDTGFMQAENVHRLDNFTNRRGIFTVGAARDRMSAADQLDDAKNAAFNIAEFLWNRERIVSAHAQIEQGLCARCLTCLRLCPYQAVAIESHITIDPQACQGCGICAAGCPARAIQMDRDDWNVDASMSRLLQHEQQKTSDMADLPRLAVFCCTRSAGQARSLALADGHPMRENIVFIEGMCGGSFSARHVLSAFDSGMDAVMVLTCHEGNCHSGSGRYRAQQNVAVARKALAHARIDPERIRLCSLAANMPQAFITMMADFEKHIGQAAP